MFRFAIVAWALLFVSATPFALAADDKPAALKPTPDDPQKDAAAPDKPKEPSSESPPEPKRGDKSAEKTPRPNIILVLADDLGIGDIGCYGQKKIPTPNIDRLAAEGMRFTDYYAGATVCAPSRCVLMTGYHGGHAYIRGNSKLSLRPGDTTAAEIVGKAGYLCGLFGKWGLGQENSPGLPTVQGFDRFYGYLDQHHAHNSYPAFLISDRRRVKLKNVVPGPSLYGSGVASEKVDYAPDLIFAEAMKFLEQHHKERFFLYLPVTIPHANNEGKQAGMEVPDLGEFKDKEWPENEKAFAAMVARMDRDLGTLMQRIKDLGIDNETVVLFSSDNGPHAEGGHDPEFFDSNGPHRGIKRALYEGGIRVPLIARWPGKIRPGSESAHIGYHGDFPATVAELAGGKVLEGWDSLSLVPAFLEQPTRQQEHEYLYWEFYEGKYAQAARLGKWKGVRVGFPPGPVEIYDLSSDPGEEKNVAKSNPEIVRHMTGLFKEAHQPSEFWTPEGGKPVDPPDPPGDREPTPANQKQPTPADPPAEKEPTPAAGDAKPASPKEAPSASSPK